MKEKIKDLKLSLAEKKDFLYDYCRLNLPEQLKEFLEQSSEETDVIFDLGRADICIDEFFLSVVFLLLNKIFYKCFYFVCSTFRTSSI